LYINGTLVLQAFGSGILSQFPGFGCFTELSDCGKLSKSLGALPIGSHPILNADYIRKNGRARLLPS
jgi:hypothetical protein